MEILLETDKKAYCKCSMYYFRRYFGVREIILMAVLLTAGLLLFFTARAVMVLILFGVTVLVLLFAVLVFVLTTVAGYKNDAVKCGIAYYKLDFTDDAIKIAALNGNKEPLFEDVRRYGSLEAIADRKNFVYIYCAVALFFPFERKILGDETFFGLKEFLRANVPEEKFKFKQTKRIFPKRKKGAAIFSPETARGSEKRDGNGRETDVPPRAEN